MQVQQLSLALQKFRSAKRKHVQLDVELVVALARSSGLPFVARQSLVSESEVELPWLANLLEEMVLGKM